MAVNKCVKYLLFFFNLLFWISGCIILGVSIYVKVRKEGNKIIGESLPAADLLIAVGVIIMVLGFLGCCGAIRENRCMLLLFFISLLIIFVLLLAAGIAGAVDKSKVQDWVKEKLDEMTPEDVRDDLEKIQLELKCCGLTKGPADWTDVPNSCRCNATGEPCSNGYYSTPCSDRIIELMEQHQETVIGIAFAIAILLIFGMVFSMMLYCQIGRKDGGGGATSNAGTA